jgi:hypothetical protein
MTRGHRQVDAREHRLADGADASEPGDQAIERGRRERGVRILQRDEAGFDRAGLGDRGGDRALQRSARGHRSLQIAAARGDDVDELGIDQQRRARQHQGSGLGVIGSEGMDDGVRRIGAPRQRLGERPPHQRRGIVEQHDHGALGGGPVFFGEVGVEIGPRESSGRLGALTGRSGAHPVEELTDDHRRTTRVAASRRRPLRPAPTGDQSRRRAVKNSFTMFLHEEFIARLRSANGRVRFGRRRRKRKKKAAPMHPQDAARKPVQLSPTGR